MDEDEVELLEPPPPLPPPPDEELELLEVLDPVDEEDELELDGVEEEELDDDVLEVLGACELDELELGVDELDELEELDEPSGPTGLPFAQPTAAARPMAIAPPLRRRRKSRRSERPFGAFFTSVGRSIGLAMRPIAARPRPRVRG